MSVWKTSAPIWVMTVLPPCPTSVTPVWIPTRRVAQDLETMGMTLRQAMEALKIPVSEYDKYEAVL